MRRLSEKLWLLLIVLCAIVSGCGKPRAFTYSINAGLKSRGGGLPRMAGGRPREVGVVRDPSGRDSRFAIGEFIFRTRNPKDFQSLLDRYHGVVLSDGKPIRISGGILPRAGFPADSSGSYLIQLDITTVSLGDFPAKMASAGVRGTFQFSSEAAAKTWALIANEGRKGIGVNFLLNPAGICEHSIPGGNLDASQFWWLSDTGLGTNVLRAWDYLRYLGLPPPPPGGTWSPTLLAIVDGGFDLDQQTGIPLNGNLDYFYRGDRPLQGDVLDHDGTAGGQNLMDCGGQPCPWHGQEVFGVAAAIPRNCYGTAGTSGDIAIPMLIRVDSSYYNWALGVRTATYYGAGVVNLSLYGDCPWWCEHSDEETLGFYDAGYEDLEGSVALARAWGTVVVACAGNEKEDTSEHDIIPCKFPGVICVGGIDQGGKNRYNYGSQIAIWAPTGIRTTMIPGAGTSPPMFWGTSASAPFVSGVVAMMKVLNPNLTFEQTKAILQSTAHPDASDGRVTKGYVDALAAVMAVRRAAPPEVRITSPVNNATISWGANPTFHADVRSPERGARPSDLTITWSSDRAGVLCSAPAPAGVSCTRNLTFGDHVITATAKDPFGTSGSSSITVHVINRPPTVFITRPSAGAQFHAGQEVSLFGGASDPDQAIPDANVQWISSRDGLLVTGRSGLAHPSVGAHTITLKATDQQGLTGQQSVIIVVLPSGGFPSARIISPIDDTMFAPGEVVHFVGSGSDPEDGTLGGSQLEWSSDIDGALGSGATLQRALSGPATPCHPEIIRHIITLKVRDSAGNEAQAQVIVLVGRVC